MDMYERSMQKFRAVVIETAPNFDIDEVVPMWIGPRWALALGVGWSAPRAVLATDAANMGLLVKIGIAGKTKELWRGDRSQLRYREGLMFERLIISGEQTKYLMPRGKSREKFERIVREER